MSYEKVIRRAVEITWRHKVLWIFGAVAAVFGGSYLSSGSGAGNWLQYTADARDWQSLRRVLPFELPIQANWEPIIATLAGAIAIAAMLGLVTLIVGLIARYTSDGALMCGVDEVERTGTTRFSSGLRAGWSRMLRLFLVDLVVSLGSFIVVLPIVVVLLVAQGLVVLPAVALVTSGGEGAVVGAIIWGILTFLVWLAVVIVVATALGAAITIVREYAFRFVALEGQGIFQSIGAAFRLAKRTLRHTLMIWLLLGLIGLALGIVLVPVALLGSGVLAATLALVYSLTESLLLTGLLSLPALLVFAGLSALLSGSYRTFVSAAWTLAYRELHEQQVPDSQGSAT